MAKTSVLTIMIQLAKKGDADRETIKGLAQLKQNVGLAIGAFTAFTGAAVAVGAALNNTVQTFVSYAAQVRELNRLTGAGAEETSRIIQAADDMTISYEDLQKALWFASKNGVEVNIESLARLADQYVALADPTKQAEFLAKSFGKGGAEMGKLLEKGGAGVRSMTSAVNGSLVLTDQAVDKARDYEIALDNWNDSVTALKISIGQGLLPTLTSLLQAITSNEDATIALTKAEEAHGTVMAGNADAAARLREAHFQAIEAASQHGEALTGLVGQSDIATLSMQNFGAAIDEISAKNKDLLSLTFNLQTETANFTAKNSELQTKYAELTIEQGKFIEGGRKYNEIQQEINETKTAIDQLAAEHEAASKRIAFSLLQQKMSADGLSNAEFAFLMGTAQNWGLVDQKTAESAVLLDAQATKMAESLSHPDSQLMDIIDKLNNLEDKSGSVYDFYVNILTQGGIPSGLGGSNPGTVTPRCFIAGTLITMADGSRKPIESVEIGDVVQSYDVDRGEFISCPVTALFTHPASEYLLINDIGVTPEHMVWSHNRRQWIAAGELVVGDEFMGDRGESDQVKAIFPIRRTNQVLVYNIEVQDVHTYFANGVLVHNAKASGFAGGGQLGSGWTVVGEQGPELISPWGYVFSNSTSREMIAGGIAPQFERWTGGDITSGIFSQEADVSLTKARTKNKTKPKPKGGASPVHSSNNPSDDVVASAVQPMADVTAAAIQSSAAAQQQAISEGIQTRKTIEAGNATIADQLQQMNDQIRTMNSTLKTSIVAAVQQAVP